MNESFNTDSFALAAGASGFARVRVKSQTNRISLLGSRLFHLFSLFYLLRFKPAPVLTDAFDCSANPIPIIVRLKG